MKTEIYTALHKTALRSASRGKYAQISIEEAPFQYQVSDRDFIDCGGGFHKFSGQQLLAAGLTPADLLAAGYTHEMMLAAGFEIRKESDSAAAAPVAPVATFVSDKFCCPQCGGQVEMRNLFEVEDAAFCHECSTAWDSSDLKSK